jgi:hypothetical protein
VNPETIMVVPNGYTMLDWVANLNVTTPFELVTMVGATVVTGSWAIKGVA